MSQTSVIFGALFLAFVIFITARGELPSYFGVLLGTIQSPEQAQAASQSNLKTAETVVQVAALFG